MFGDPSGLAPEKHKQGNGDVLLGGSFMWKNMAAVAENSGAKTNISTEALNSIIKYPVDISTTEFMFSWMTAAHELGHIFDALRLGHDPFFDIPAGVREWWAIDSENMMRVKMGFGNVLKSKSDLFGVSKYVWYGIQSWFYNRGIDHADY
jgi:hypothetical protein